MTMSCMLMFANKTKVFADDDVISNSKAFYCVEPTTKTVIKSKNEDERLPIASMCKIMTLLLVFESVDNGQLSYDQKIVISEDASSMGGSQIFLEENGEYSVGELIKGIVVASANDACVALAEKISGSEDEFVLRMNEKAESLEMKNTLFSNCTGLPKPVQYSSAKDVAIMFSELIKHEDYFRFARIWTDKIIHPKDRITEISNTNKLIRFYQGCDGGKTGYTSEAGHCLCATAQRNDMRLVSVVIGASDSKTRFAEVSGMFNYGFANYVNKKIIDENSVLDLEVNVLGGKKDKLEVVAENSVCIFSKRADKRSFEISFNPIVRVKAPIKKGDLVGELTVYENGKEISSVKVLSNENVECKTYFDYIKDVGLNWAIF